MAVATFLSRILGLVREQVFAYEFGAGRATDAFQVAFRIPNLLRDLFAEGALSSALVPTFTQMRQDQGERRAWRLAGLVFRALLGGVLVLSLVGMWAAPALVATYAGAYRSDPEKLNLTIRLTRELFPFFPCVALAAAFMAVLNAGGSFFLPAFASALFNLSSIVSGLAAARLLTRFPQWGWAPIEGMALGVVVGGAVQALCQLRPLYAQGYRWRRREPGESIWYREPALRKMLLLMIPGVFGLAATQLNLLVNTILATSLGSGAVSYLNYAFRLMQFPIGILGVSLASATLPAVSRAWSAGDPRLAARTLEQSLQMACVLNVPASLGLATLGPLIVQVLYEYGQFRAPDTAATARALSMYAIGLTAYSLVKILVPTCYAIGQTRAAVVSSALAVATTISLNLIFIQWGIGHAGLALGTSLAALVNASYLFWRCQREFRAHAVELNWSVLGETLAKTLLVAGAMALVCHLSLLGLQQYLGGSLAQPGGRILSLALLVAIAGMVFVLLGRLCRLNEIHQIWVLVSRRIGRPKN